jgi:hypothetical protein
VASVRSWALLLILAPAIAHAETITYELYDISTRPRMLLAKGVKHYTAKDIVVEDEWFGRSASLLKEIPIAEGFSAGAVVYRGQRALTGFALKLQRHGGFMGVLSQGGFSWDWFDLESGSIFRKLQGGGRIKVTWVPSTEFQEIAAVEVLEDITLRVIGHPWWFFTTEDTHHLVVRKGSVLRFAP